MTMPLTNLFVETVNIYALRLCIPELVPSELYVYWILLESCFPLDFISIFCLT